jgi:hypothetical protein
VLVKDGPEFRIVDPVIFEFAPEEVGKRGYQNEMKAAVKARTQYLSPARIGVDPSLHSLKDHVWSLAVVLLEMATLRPLTDLYQDGALQYPVLLAHLA